MKLSENLLYTLIIVYLILNLVLDNYVSISFKKYIIIPIWCVLLVLLIIHYFKKWRKK